MSENLLPRKFFKNNPLKMMSHARVAYYMMSLDFSECLTPMLNEELEKDSSVQRVEKIEKEREKISSLENGEAVVEFIRHGFDIANGKALFKKALSMPEEVFPLLLRRFRTSFQDEFVDPAVHLLAQADEIYIDQLIAMYPEIRNPYAQSMACLIFGIRMREDTLPLLLSEYERMQKDPDQDMCQGPLLALYLLYDQELPLL